MTTTRASKSKYDRTEKTTVRELIAAAQTDAQALRDEIDETLSALEERFSSTSRYETLSETKDNLDNVADADEPEVLDAFDAEVEFTWRYKPRPSRADRRDEIVARLTTAQEAIDHFITNAGDAQSDTVDAAVAAADQVADWIGTLEVCEFPGMRG